MRSSEATFYYSRSFARNERDGSLMVQGLGYGGCDNISQPCCPTIFAE